MKIRGLILAHAIALSGCATSGTQVLAPYQLADGTKLQDVVTIGADKTGTAPVVTHVQTFRLGGKNGGVLVSDGTGSGAGLNTVITGAVVAGVTGGVTGGLIANSYRRDGNSNTTNSDPCVLNPRQLGCPNLPKPGDLGTPGDLTTPNP